QRGGAGVLVVFAVDVVVLWPLLRHAPLLLLFRFFCFPHLIRAWRLFESDGLPGEQLPIAILLVPHHQDANLHWIGFPVTFGLTSERVPYDGVVVDNLDGLVRDGDELPRGLSACSRVDKLGLILDPACR